MIDKLIEGKLLTVLVGSVFRLVEILVRTVHVTVRGIRLLVQEVVTSRIDTWLSSFGKRMVANRTRVEQSSIVLIERDGEYTGDPKYIAEEILRRGAPLTITWVLRDRSIGPFPSEFHFVKYGTAEYFRSVAGAKVVVQNAHCLQESGVVKGSSQQWVQTWHDPLGLKRLDSAGRDRRSYLRLRELDNTQTDVLLTNSTFEDDVFTETYWPDVPKSRIGHPRNDVLSDTSQETATRMRKKALDRLDIADTGQRFLLYGPTRGGDPRATPLSGIDVNAVRAALSERFGGTWEILIRTHNSDKAQSDVLLAGLPAYCHNASFHPDVQELLVLADAGMTDGAGWICDYLLTAKPAFLFSTHERGTSRDLEKLPLPLATSNHALLRNIEQFDHEVHGRKIGQFLEVSGSVDDGHAASRVVDRLEELISR